MSKARDLANAGTALGAVTATELGYVDGVTSAIQTQIDAKTAKSTLTTTGDIYYASSASTPARLGIGSTDQILKVTGGVPAWATPASSAPISASARVTTSQNSSSATYADLATAGPAVTLTTGTKAMVIVGARVQASSGWNGNMSYAVSGATTVAANDEWSIMSFDGYSQQFSFASTQVSLTAGSNTFTAKYKTGSAENPCTFSNRYIIVIDLGS
jgi:hypothetical protein